MRFTVDGRTYAIDFQRDYRSRDHYEEVAEEQADGTVKLVTVKTTVKSTYPYTTVKILEVDDTIPRKDWKVYRTYTVGCATSDRFSPEAGRKAALRMALGTGILERPVGVIITPKLKELLLRQAKVFRSAAWKAYFDRHAVAEAARLASEARKEEEAAKTAVA